MSDFNIREELNKLPKSPGVYIMHDEKDAIIYVGKAVNLSNRVRSYFRESTKKTLKIQKMVSLIDHFEYILTSSELEALVLENNLIKEHSPKYNTMLKDDKTYPYIKISLYEKYPRIIFTRNIKKDKAKYYGPFTSADAVKETIDLLNKLYRLKTCNLALVDNSENNKPCLNYHINKCDAPCINNVSEVEYREKIKKVMNFLDGDSAGVIKELEDKMYAFSDKLEFEKAKEVKDLIDCVRTVMNRQKINSSDMESRDYVAIALNSYDVIAQVFFVREGRLIGREHFYMKHAQNESREDILTCFLNQYYSGTPYIPKEIIIEDEIEGAGLLEEYLSTRTGRRITIRVPKKGQKEKMLELARENAELVLKQDTDKIKRQKARTIGACEEISRLLKLPNLSRMEAFDISNTSGFANVASMVVFEDGKPKKSDYRKFRIKSVTTPDDYACMKEVLTRRFTHNLRTNTNEFAKMPDVIMMDGGKGQVNICRAVLDELNLNIPVCGMVKDDNHRTRGIFYNNVELPIDTRSEGFLLVTRIQDEAHRFAIEYHRSLRSKEQVHSVLDEIPGVGPKRRIELMKSFSSIDELKNADVDRILECEGMNLRTATEIYNFFHKESGER